MIRFDAKYHADYNYIWFWYMKVKNDLEKFEKRSPTGIRVYVSKVLRIGKIKKEKPIFG